MDEPTPDAAALLRMLARAEAARRQHSEWRPLVFSTEAESDAEAAWQAQQPEPRRVTYIPSNGRGPGEQEAANAALAAMSPAELAALAAQLAAEQTERSAFLERFIRLPAHVQHYLATCSHEEGCAYLAALDPSPESADAADAAGRHRPAPSNGSPPPPPPPTPTEPPVWRARPPGSWQSRPADRWYPGDTGPTKPEE